MFKSISVETEKCSTGLEQNVSVLLAYLFGPLGGLIFYLVEKENKFVRFCAMQSLIIGTVWLAVLIVFSFLSFIPFLGIIFAIASPLFSLSVLVLLIFLIVQGFKNVKISLNIIGDLSEHWSEQPED